MMRAKEKRRNCIWAIGPGRDASQSRGTGGLIGGAGADLAAGEDAESPLAPGPHCSVWHRQHLSALNVSGGAACLGAALHPRLRKPAASLARGLGKSLPRPTGSAWQLGVTAAAAGSKCTEGPRDWRRLAGERRGGRVPSL